MSKEEAKSSDGGSQTNGDVVIPQERVKKPTRPDDVAQKSVIDELQSSSMCLFACLLGKVLTVGVILPLREKRGSSGWMGLAGNVPCIILYLQ